MEGIKFRARSFSLNDKVKEYEELPIEEAERTGRGGVKGMLEGYARGDLDDEVPDDILNRTQELEAEVEYGFFDKAVDIPIQAVYGFNDAIFAGADYLGFDLRSHMPEQGDPKSIAGGIVRGTAQSITAIAGAGTISTALAPQLLLNTAGRLLAVEGVGSFFGMTGEEGRVSDLISEHAPMLSNPLVEFMKTDGSDGKIASRFKQSLDSVFGTVLGGAMFGVFSTAARARTAKKATEELIDVNKIDIVQEARATKVARELEAQRAIDDQKLTEAAESQRLISPQEDSNRLTTPQKQDALGEKELLGSEGKKLEEASKEQIRQAEATITGSEQSISKAEQKLAETEPSNAKAVSDLEQEISSAEEAIANARATIADAEITISAQATISTEPTIDVKLRTGTGKELTGDVKQIVSFLQPHITDVNVNLNTVKDRNIDFAKVIKNSDNPNITAETIRSGKAYADISSTKKVSEGVQAVNIYTYELSNFVDYMIGVKNLLSNPRILDDAMIKLVDMYDLSVKTSEIVGISNISANSLQYAAYKGLKDPENIIRALSKGSKEEGLAIVAASLEGYSVKAVGKIEQSLGVKKANLDSASKKELKDLKKELKSKKNSGEDVSRIRENIKRAESDLSGGNAKIAEKQLFDEDILRRQEDEQLRTFKKAIQDAKGDSEKQQEMLAQVSELLNVGKNMKYVVDSLEILSKTKRQKVKDIQARLFRTAILSGPSTSVLNVVSGLAIGGVYRPLEMAATASVSKIRQGLSGMTTDKGATFGDVYNYMNAYGGSISDMFQYANVVYKASDKAKGSWKQKAMGAVEAIETTIDAQALKKARVEGANKGNYFQIDNPNPTMLDTLGKWVYDKTDPLFDSMGAVDSIVQSAAYTAEKRIGLDRLKRNGINNIDEARLKDLNDYASNKASETTFQQEPTEFAQKVLDFHKFIERTVDDRIGIPFSTFLAPVLKTPLNIMSWKLDRTGVANIFLKDIQDGIRAGGFAKDEALSKVAIGAGALLLSYQLADRGLITGAGIGKNNFERSVSGIMPNSINVGGTFVNYTKIPILSELLPLPNTLMEMMQVGGDGGAEDSEEGMGVMLSFMSGVSSLSTTLFDSAKGTVGFSTYSDILTALQNQDNVKLGSIINNIGAGLLAPNALSAPARHFLQSHKQDADGFKETFYRKLGIDTGTNMLDALGNEIPKNQTYWWSLGMVDHSYNNLYADDNTYGMLASVGANISRHSRNMEGVQLSGTEYNELLSIMKELKSEKIMREAFSNSTDIGEERGKLLQSLHSQLKGAAKTLFLSRHPEIQAKIDRQANKPITDANLFRGVTYD